MKEPVDHILRPCLPWRDVQFVTECGINAVSVKTLSRDEFKLRLKEMGQQRTAILTCMTCSHTMRRYTSWEEDPRLAIEREIAWEGASWNAYSESIRNTRGTLLRDELEAIALLIESHKPEFKELVEARQITRFFAEEGEKHRKSKGMAP